MGKLAFIPPCLLCELKSLLSDTLFWLFTFLTQLNMSFYLSFQIPLFFFSDVWVTLAWCNPDDFCYVNS